MNELDYIKLEALSLGEDESITALCPNCGRNKLGITRREGSILYQCWRPSCNTKGVIGGSVGYSEDKVKPPPPTFFQKESSFLGRNFYEEYLSKYEIKLTTLRMEQFRKILGVAGISMNLFNGDGKYFGKTTKYFGSGNKAMHYIEDKTQPMLHYTRNRCLENKDTVILVEDVLSAIKVTQYCNIQGVALLGTTLNDDKVRALLKQGYKKVVLWLDWDAREKAHLLKRKYNLFFSEFHVLETLSDPKDLGHEYMKKTVDLLL